MKLQPTLLKAAAFAGLALSLSVAAPAGAATLQLTGVGSGTVGIDDTDVTDFGGAYGSNLSYTGGVLTQADAYSTVTQISTGASFTQSYTFDLTSAASVSFDLNTSPNGAISFGNTATLGSTTVVSSPASTTTDTFYNTGVLSAGWHTLTFSGSDLIANKVVGITGTATVSPVPLPGALVLFGSGLIGVVARRRKLVKGAVKAAALAALPLVAVGFASSANAASVSLTDNVGTVTTTSPLHATLTEGSTTVKNNTTYYVKAGTSTATSTAAIGSITADYDFVLSSASKLAVTLTPAVSNPSVSYELFKNGTQVAATTTTTSGANSLVENFANLASGSYVLQVVTNFAKGSKVTITGTVSAVPVPGALFLFGSGLAALGIARRRRRQAA